jgi:hypothetical protein
VCDSSKCLGLGDVDVALNILSLWAVVVMRHCVILLSVWA